MQNSRKIFSQIYDQCIEKIYRFIFLKVNSQEAAQDLTSETFLKFWKRFNKSQEPAIENPRAFLYQIARNSIIDYYRQRPKSSLIPLEGIQIKDPNINPEKEVLLDSDLQELNLALTKIPEDYQDVIIWYYLDELAISEIAEILDKSENTVRVTIHRALKTLREAIDNQF